MDIEYVKNLVSERNRLSKELFEILFEDIKNKVEAFCSYPVLVQHSCDGGIICVDVFCVPKEDEDKITDFIHLLDNEIYSELGFLLCPMIKSREVTEKYYPKYLK